MKSAAFRYQARPHNGRWGVWDSFAEDWEVSPEHPERDAKLYARDYQRGYDANRYNSAGGACFDD